MLYNVYISIGSHIQAQALADVQEALHICLAIPLELPRQPLMKVPGYVELR